MPIPAEHDITALVAEDDDYDFLLLERALRLSNPRIRVKRARDGAEAREYLLVESPFDDRKTYPVPAIVLLDLKMPRMSGFDFLEWIHANPDYAVIPTVVMSNSKQEKDVQRAYRLGTNTFFSNRPPLKSWPGFAGSSATIGRKRRPLRPLPPRAERPFTSSCYQWAESNGPATAGQSPNTSSEPNTAVWSHPREQPTWARLQPPSLGRAAFSLRFVEARS
jgi:CheY-like chemotaxis protein